MIFGKKNLKLVKFNKKVEILEKNLTHRFHAHDFSWQINHGGDDEAAAAIDNSKKVDFIKVNLNIHSLVNDEEHHHDTTEETGEKSAQVELSTGNPFVSMWTSEVTSREFNSMEEITDLSQTTQYMMTTNSLSTTKKTERERSTAQNQITTQIPSFTTGRLLQ